MTDIRTKPEYFNKQGHLTWYNMESSDPAKAIGVDLGNPFGKQKIVIYGVVGLLIPDKIYRVVKQT